ncbi:MAG TPA: hypothetical protein VMV10_17335 [Pirellulales bacterium]|nr:hypothetical protein [Pirellulales bacterium]
MAVTKKLLIAAIFAAAMSSLAVASAGEREFLGVPTRPAAEKSPVDLNVKGRERYEYEHGRWWYRMPGGHWVLWNGKQWIDAKPSPALAAARGWGPVGGLEPTIGDELDRTQGRLASEQGPRQRLAALDAARSALTPTFPEPSYVDSYWLRRYNYNPGVYGMGPGPGAFLSPFYRHTIFPPPVGQFNYGTFGPYMGGALSGGMANGFLGRFP